MRCWHHLACPVTSDENSAVQMIKTGRSLVLKWNRNCWDGSWNCRETAGKCLLAECSTVRFTWKEGLTVCACIALNLHISCFEPTDADGNWFKVGCSRHGDETVSDSVQHQDLAASSSLLEWIPLQLLSVCVHLLVTAVCYNGGMSNVRKCTMCEIVQYKLWTRTVKYFKF